MDRFFDFIGNHPILVSAFLIFLFALIVTERRKGGQSVTTQELVRMTNHESAVLVDLRDRNEFSRGHITGAINVPYSTLSQRIEELQKYRDKPVILVCKIGQHSCAAGSPLIKGGFQDVRRLSGGMTEWTGANLPVVKG